MLTDYNGPLLSVNGYQDRRPETPALSRGHGIRLPHTVSTVPKTPALEALIDEVVVSAHDVDEQLMGFLHVFLDEVPLPTPATLLGVAIEVTGFDSEGDERRGLVALCRHRDNATTISLADVRFDPSSTWMG